MSRVHVGERLGRGRGRPDSLIGCDCLSLSNSVGERGAGPAARSLTSPLRSATLTGEEGGFVARWRAELLLCVCDREGQRSAVVLAEGSAASENISCEKSAPLLCLHREHLRALLTLFARLNSVVQTLEPTCVKVKTCWPKSRPLFHFDKVKKISYDWLKMKGYTPLKSALTTK